MARILSGRSRRVLLTSTDTNRKLSAGLSVLDRVRQKIGNALNESRKIAVDIQRPIAG